MYLNGPCTYQVLLFATSNPDKMEHEEFETVTMFLRKLVDRLAEVGAAIRLILDR